MTTDPDYMIQYIVSNEHSIKQYRQCTHKHTHERARAHTHSHTHTHTHTHRYNNNYHSKRMHKKLNNFVVTICSEIIENTELTGSMHTSQMITHIKKIIILYFMQLYNYD